MMWLCQITFLTYGCNCITALLIKCHISVNKMLAFPYQCNCCYYFVSQQSSHVSTKFLVNVKTNLSLMSHNHHVSRPTHLTSFLCWQSTAGTTAAWWWGVATCLLATSFSSHRTRSETISQTSRRGIIAASYCRWFIPVWHTPGA